MHHHYAAFVLLGLVGVTIGGAAPKVLGKSLGYTKYEAVLLHREGGLNGSLVAVNNADGYGTNFELSFDSSIQSLPSSKLPLLYHIHENPVGFEGDCNKTGGHFNPFKAGKKCNKDDKANCELGDLSGKFGDASSDTGGFKKSFGDPYLSLNTEDQSFFGNLSFVVHDKDLNIINCGDFARVGGGLISTTESDPMPSSTSSSSSKTSSSDATTTTSGTDTTTKSDATTSASLNPSVFLSDLLRIYGHGSTTTNGKSSTATTLTTKQTTTTHDSTASATSTSLNFGAAMSRFMNMYAHAQSGTSSTATTLSTRQSTTGKDSTASTTSTA